MKSLCILGSTGSIGRQALDIVAKFPDRFAIIALTANSQVTLLAAQARQFHARYAVIMREELASQLTALLVGTSTQVLAGMEGLLQVATMRECDMVVAAMVGAVGLQPILAAAQAGKAIALANKEPIVAAGEMIMKAVADGQATLLPVDSEPSAIFQCLQGHDRAGLARIWLTASGGALQHLSLEELTKVTPQQALKHPTWAMGEKITIDSATLMNKGLEVIEAHWLFNVPLQDIQVVIHPQSIIHSFIEFHDGVFLAQLGMPCMRTPIQYALSYPERLVNNWASLDLTQLNTLTFMQPDFSRFPCPRLAQQAAITGGTMPACLNAANEVAVMAFLQERIGFREIPQLVERALEDHQMIAHPDLTTILAVDVETREKVMRWAGISV